MEPRSSFTFLHGINLQGSDLVGLRKVTSASECLTRCQSGAWSDCVAFTFIRHVPINSRACWLKKPGYDLRNSSGTVSGILRAESRQRQVAVVTHHKTGTVMGYKLVMALCCPSQLIARSIDIWTPWFHTCRAQCAQAGVRFLYDGLQSALFRRTKKEKESSKLPASGVVVHFIRHPIDMVISAYRYHLTCPESWLRHSPLASATGKRGEMLERFGSRRSRQELAAMLNASSMDATYCELLQRAPSAVGVAVEAKRQLHAHDGWAAMLRDDAMLRSAQYETIHVCTSDVGPDGTAMISLAAKLDMPQSRLKLLLEALRNTYAAHSTSGRQNERRGHSLLELRAFASAALAAHTPAEGSRTSAGAGLTPPLNFRGCALEGSRVALHS